MQNRFKALVGVAGALAAIAVMLPAAPATAVEDVTVTQARSFLVEYGADQDTQDRLIAAYLAGDRWDSMTSGSVPTSVEHFQGPGGEYSVSTFGDGSIAVARTETPAATANPMQRGITGCTASGSVRSNCKIDMWVGLVALSFYASYNLAANTVTNTYGAGWSIGGACGVSLVYLGRPASNVGRMDISAQMCGIPYSTTFWLQLTLRNGSAAVSWSA